MDLRVGGVGLGIEHLTELITNNNKTGKSTKLLETISCFHGANKCFII